MRLSRMQRLLELMTRRQGERLERAESVKDIKRFIDYFEIDMSEIEVPAEGFQNFNQFFYRKLKPGARPIASPDDATVAVSPADARLIVFASVSLATRFWIKGREFTIANMLGDAQLADHFGDGSLAAFRLAPQDYHRFHFPCDGRYVR